jgi:lipopolysaccharide/colanic/teichoic acid biosynthesis glycosyltransferase
VSLLADRAIAMVLLVLSSPVLALAALAIRVESGPPVLFRQRRVGRGGEPFDLLKLRTMVAGAASLGRGLAVDQGDPRITRVGAVLRRFSIDELPNLVNVLRGDMAIIGPRPTVPVQVEQYTDRQRGRLALRPGITGWAQVNGWRGETDTEEKIQRRVEHDLYYIENWSVFFDLYILAVTPFALLKSDNAY